MEISPRQLNFKQHSDKRLPAPKRSGFFLALLILLTVALLMLIIISLLLGSASLSLQEIYAGLFHGTPGTTAYDVLWNLRLPRTLLAVVVGIHFALAGLILQTVIRNPLADPGVVGVSGGASLAIVVFLLMAESIQHALKLDSSLSLNWLPLAALFGGLLAAALVLSLAWRSGISPGKLALNGIAVGTMLNAMVMWTVLVWGGARTELSILWLAGSLYGRDFSHLLILLPWTFAGLVALLFIQRPLALLRFDDDLAQSLGLQLHYWRVIAISIAVALTASAIAVAGPIGFVGLIVPHLARLLIGNQLKQLFVVCALCGAGLTLTADILSRTLLSPLELPAGALTTLIGIPVLLFLLQRQEKGLGRSSAC